jgi:hypothetical protein
MQRKKPERLHTGANDFAFRIESSFYYYQPFAPTVAVQASFLVSEMRMGAELLFESIEVAFDEFGRHAPV